MQSFGIFDTEYWYLFSKSCVTFGGGGLLKTGSLFMLAVSFRLSARLSCVTAKLQTTDYVRIKFFGYQLKVSQRRHACGCWLTSNIQYMAHIDYTILYKYICKYLEKIYV